MLKALTLSVIATVTTVAIADIAIVKDSSNNVAQVVNFTNENNTFKGTFTGNVTPSAHQHSAGDVTGSVHFAEGVWQYFYGSETNDGSWRMGYTPVTSNVVVQVRVTGTWTNTVQFLAP
jgi:hypothetical protein